MRYFFHIRDEGTLVRDQEGSILPDLAAAINEAECVAKDIVADELRGGPAIKGKHVEVFDGKGIHLKTLPIINVLK